MIRFKESLNYHYVDYHLAANLITFLIFWNLQEFESALKYAASSRRLLRRIQSRTGVAATEEDTKSDLRQDTSNSGYNLPGFQSKFSKENLQNIQALVELALAQCSFQIRPSWHQFQQIYSRVKHTLVKMQSEGEEPQFAGYSLLLRFYKGMALKRQQTQNYKMRPRTIGQSPQTSPRRKNSSRSNSPAESRMPRQSKSQERVGRKEESQTERSPRGIPGAVVDSLKRGQLDPFGWKETLECFAKNLFIPFKDNALPLRDGELKRLKQKAEKPSEYFEQFRRKKEKFERKRAEASSIQNWLWNPRQAGKSGKERNISSRAEINNNDLRVGSSAVPPIFQETRQSGDETRRYQAAKNRKLGQIYDAYEHRGVLAKSLDSGIWLRPENWKQLATNRSPECSGGQLLRRSIENTKLFRKMSDSTSVSDYKVPSKPMQVERQGWLLDQTRAERKIASIISDCSRQLRNVNSLLMSDILTEELPQSSISTNRGTQMLSPKPVQEPQLKLNRKESDHSTRINEIIGNPSYRFEVLDQHPKIAPDIDGAIRKVTQGGFSHDKQVQQMRKSVLTSFFSTQDLASIRELTPLDRRYKASVPPSAPGRPRGLQIKDSISMKWEGHHQLDLTLPNSKFRKVSRDMRPKIPKPKPQRLADALNQPLRPRRPQSQSITPPAAQNNSLRGLQHTRFGDLGVTSLDQFERPQQVVSPHLVGPRVAIQKGQRIFTPLRQGRFNSSSFSSDARKDLKA